LPVANKSVAARRSKITPSIKVSSFDVAESIEGFRNGSINLIVTTSVIEEGKFFL